MFNSQKIITWQQYSNHITPQDCWVLIDGYLYDVSDYLVEHPGGDDILLKYSGIDATVPFTQQQHSSYAISLRDARTVGKIQSPVYDEQYRLMLQQKKRNLKKSQKKGLEKNKSVRLNIPLQEVSRNNTEKSCWIIIDSKVYDVTKYMSSHPGGQGLLLDKAGKDATSAFKEANHSISAVQKRDGFLIGFVQKAQKGSMSNLLFVALGIIVLLSIVWVFLGSQSDKQQ